MRNDAQHSKRLAAGVPQGSLLGLVLLNELEKGVSNDTAKSSDGMKFFLI